MSRVYTVALEAGNCFVSLAQLDTAFALGLGSQLATIYYWTRHQHSLTISKCSPLPCVGTVKGTKTVKLNCNDVLSSNKY